MLNREEITRLRAAHRLLKNGWCKGSFGQTIDGKKVGYSDLHKADKVCLSGAIIRVTDNRDQASRLRAAIYRNLKSKRKCLIAFNERADTKLEDVLHLFEETIFRCEQSLA